MSPVVKLQLSYAERRALEEMAEQNMRRPSEELRYLFNQEARRRGLLPPMHEAGATVLQAESAGFANIPN